MPAVAQATSTPNAGTNTATTTPMSTHKTAKPPAPKLAVESTTVQFPLVDHAVAVGWQPVTPEAALGKRRGEGGLSFYDDLAAARWRLNTGGVTPDRETVVTGQSVTVRVDLGSRRIS